MVPGDSAFMAQLEGSTVVEEYTIPVVSDVEPQIVGKIPLSLLVIQFLSLVIDSAQVEHPDHPHYQALRQCFKGTDECFMKFGMIGPYPVGVRIWRPLLALGILALVLAPLACFLAAHWFLLYYVYNQEENNYNEPCSVSKSWPVGLWVNQLLFYIWVAFISLWWIPTYCRTGKTTIWRFLIFVYGYPMLQHISV